jgi:transcriptional regulator
VYLPRHFREERAEVLAAAIEAHPLGLTVRATPAGLTADPLPFLLDGAAAVGGRLVAHVARANPIVAELGKGEEVLVVFSGPQGYVSPSWYPSKAEGGRVVPTWNYVVVEVRGRARLMDDAAFTRAVVARLTSRHEAGRAEPWSTDDAPEAYLAGQLKGIVGLEVEITAIVGKWKVSQNRSATDRAGVVAGLAAEGASDMADLVAAEIVTAGDGEPTKIG